MNQIIGPQEGRIDVSLSYLDLLEKFFKKIKFSLKGKREIMFSDIINLIARENYTMKFCYGATTILSKEKILFLAQNLCTKELEIAIENIF